MTDLDFAALLQPVPRSAVFHRQGWHVWCGSVTCHENRYYLLFSQWPQAAGHDGWVTHSEIGWASGPGPEGPFTYGGVALGPAGGPLWDAQVTHNPVVLECEGLYYLYYMGNRGDGTYWDNRNHQCIGVAVAPHPAGPWKRFDQPALSPTADSWDCLVVTNPTVCRGLDGRFFMIYKGVGTSAAPLPRGGPVVLGLAVAPTPLGPFTKVGGPLLSNPENSWSVEDPFLWHDGRKFCLLVKDFQGYFTKRGPSTVALFESEDCQDWKPAAHPFAFERRLVWEDGEVQTLDALERPFLWFEDGRPSVLLCAVGIGADRSQSFNVQIPLRRPK